MNEPEKLHIVRLVAQGSGLYLCVPARVVRALALKVGDRLICDYDQEQVFLKRLALEAFLPLRQTPARPVNRIEGDAARVSTVR